MQAAAASDNANSHRRRRVHLQPLRKCIRGCTGVPAVQAVRWREGKNTTASPSPTPRSARAVHSRGCERKKDGWRRRATGVAARTHVCTTSYACRCTTPGPHGRTTPVRGDIFHCSFAKEFRVRRNNNNNYYYYVRVFPSIAAATIVACIII